jgi:uncharacterized protein (DUF1800 family)
VATPATADDVSRLYARAAFGARSTDLTTFTGQDYATVVAALFPPASTQVDTSTLPPLPSPAPAYPAAPILPTIPPAPDEVRRTQLESGTTDILAGQRWWLGRMATTAYPLVERMTLFWHTHFATAFAQPPDLGNLIVQNQTIRRNALGDLRTMLYELTVDPAMLYWLSGYVNRRNFVNENYGRELLELFTMGTKPQTYTETDIRQAAKALTGWYIKSDRTAAFDTNRHDRTVKTIFGTNVGGYPASDPREAVEYREVVDLALRQPTTARFIAYKMVCSFGYVPTTSNLVTSPDPLVDAVASTLRPALPDGKWDLTAAMQVLLNHQDFRYPDRAGAEGSVRSPIEVTVHLAKAMQVNCDPQGGWNDTNNGQYNQPIFALRRMGQVPFQPPNVGGWPKGTQWLSAITTRGRYDLVQFMINQYNTQNGATLHPMPASTDIPGWVAYLGLGSLSAVTQGRLNSYLANPGTSDERTKQNSILFLLVSSPDWQVI